MRRTALIVMLTLVCFLSSQGALSASPPSPWKQVGKQITFNTRTRSHTMSPDGKMAAWTSAGKHCDDCNQGIVLHDVLTGKERRITPPPSPETKSAGWHDVQSLRFSPDSTLLAANISLPGRKTCRIDLYDTKSGQRVNEWRYKMHDDVLHTTEITEFVGHRLTVADEFYGIYTIDAGKLVSFVEKNVNFIEEPDDKVGSLHVWVQPQIKEGLASVFGPSILYISTGGDRPLSLKPGSSVAAVRVLPESNAFLTLEIGGPKYPAPGVMTVDGGGAAYCRDATNGRVLYKVADVGGISGSLNLSRDGKTLMLADWNLSGADMTIRFFRR